MNKASLQYWVVTIFVGFLCFFSNLTICYAVEQTPAPIVYYKYTTSEHQLVHVAEVDPKQTNIIAASALDLGKRRESVAEIAKFHHALLAINGGFFRIGGAQDGLPAGILKHHDEWHGIAYKVRGAIGWGGDNKSDPLMDRLQTQTVVKIGHRHWPVHLMNQPGHRYKTVLYSRAYGTELDANQQGMHVVIKENRVAAVMKHGGVAIPSGGYVYSIGVDAKLDRSLIQVGAPVQVSVNISPQFNPQQKKKWQQCRYIVGGAPLLIYNGFAVQNHQPERIRQDFLTQSYARTAIGVLPDGRWLFVVVEKNPIMNHQGISIPALALLLQKLNCRYALNLDGGGSSTMYLSNKIVNTTQGDEDEGLNMIAIRKVSDAILVLDRKKLL